LYNFWNRLPPERIFVLAPKVKGWREFDCQQPFEVVRYKTTTNPAILCRLWNCIVLFFHSLRLICTRSVKKLHCGQPISAGIVALLVKQFFKVPYCVYVYGGETAKYEKYKVVIPLLRLILKKSEKIVVNSKFTHQEFLGYGIGAERLVKITPGVDVEVFRPDLEVDDLKAKYGLADKKVLLTVARLSERKGHDMVIRALPQVIKRVPQATYIIVGEGPQEDTLRKLVHSEKLQSYVLFTGFVPEVDLPRYYALCDVFVMPNRETQGEETFEGFGTSFIEAGACGKPVIGGRSGGVSDAVEDGVTGVLVNPRNAGEIAHALIRFLTDEEYAMQLGEQGRARAEREFRWETLAKEVEALL
jgi:phosphatidylinositol alpha-1,6-mannosyltransferase